MIGVVIGTYSSIFVASPVVLEWQIRHGGKRQLKMVKKNIYEAAIKLGVEKKDIENIVNEPASLYKSGGQYGVVKPTELYKSGGQYGVIKPSELYKSGGQYGTISPKDFR